jgi:hypothetical protein
MPRILQSGPGIESDGLRALLYTLPGRRRAEIGRIDIGAQEVAGNAGGSFNGENVLGGKALPLLNPLPHGSTRHVAQPGKPGLRACGLNCCEQCVIRYQMCNHSCYMYATLVAVNHHIAPSRSAT